MNTTETPIVENFDALSEPQRSELTQWFCVRKTSDAAAIKRCLTLWNLAVTPEKMKEFRARARALWNQVRNLERLKAGAAVAHVFQKQITDHPAEVFDILFRASGQAMFELSLDGTDKSGIKLIHEHLRLLLARRKDDRDEKRFALAREKWEFEASEACLEKLPELKVISDAPQLSFKEKLRQIRLKLFGSAT